MQSPEPFLIFTQPLHALGLRYMISGSVAAIYYGEPRMTNGVDIILHMKSNDVARLEQAFPLEDFYCPPGEIIALELAREQRGHFNLIHHETGFKADIYLSHSPLHVWGLAHAKSAELDGMPITIAPPEYVMVRKLQFFREGQSPKHLRDISRMLTGLGPEWSRESLMQFIAEHGLGAEWEQVLAIEER